MNHQQFQIFLWHAESQRGREVGKYGPEGGEGAQCRRDYVTEINNNNIVHLKSDKAAFLCTFTINSIESRLSICTKRIKHNKMK